MLKARFLGEKYDQAIASKLRPGYTGFNEGGIEVKLYESLVSYYLRRIPLGILFFALSALLISACDTGKELTGGGDLSFRATDLPNETAVVIETYDLNIETETLTIYGFNFDIGEWGAAEVRLDNSQLNVISQAADEIVTSLPGAATTTGSFLLTVQTGPYQENFDAFGVVMGDADPLPPLNQLLVRNYDLFLDEDLDRVELIISGHNFDNGNWPPFVALGTTELNVDVDVDASDADQIVAYAPVTLIDVPENRLLRVQTGTDVENYDVTLAYGTADNPPSPPSDGETQCNLGICWKEGPGRTNLCSTHPRYYELMEDYELKLSTFYHLWTEDNLKLPRMANRYGRNIQQYFGLMGDLPEVAFEDNTNRGYKWDFVSIIREGIGIDAVLPTLKIKKGYRWDGTTRPCRRFDEEMRSGFIHDVMYDLIRFETIPWKDSYQGVGKRQADRNNINNRELADMLFYWINMQDREQFSSPRPLDPDGAYYTLQHDGMSRANYHIEKHAEWRFHTLVNAMVSGENSVMEIDGDGNKTFTMSCALPNSPVEFDASMSRPITDSPTAARRQSRDDLHETTWLWSLNDEVLVPMRKNNVGQLLDRSTLRRAFTVSELENAAGWPSNLGNSVKLHIDSGKGTPFYEREEEVTVSIEFDTEPPVITGISDPITKWPPNHKYVTFRIADFVTSVTDNCSTITLDDLVITQVTSDEPENAKGDGDTVGDIVIATDRKSVDLRIERQGMGDGRGYAVTIEAVDDRNNAATESFWVQVPHS